MHFVFQSTTRSLSYNALRKNQSLSLAVTSFSRQFSSCNRNGLSSFTSITAKQRASHSFSYPCRRLTTDSSRDESQQKQQKNLVVYEGPFANLALRLKRISITTAIASIVGAPAIVILGSNLPVSGQLAVGGTAMFAACGSTAALSFCFSPYIHTLEWIPVRKCNNTSSTATAHNHHIPREEKSFYENTETIQQEEYKECQTFLLKATTRNLFSMKCETVFDPSQVKHVGDFQTYRPFCNFMVNDKHFFIHPELLHDDTLRIQLLGEEKGTLVPDYENTNMKKKDPDDDFL